jgi:hypothetical protein
MFEEFVVAKAEFQRDVTSAPTELARAPTFLTAATMLYRLR